MNATTLSIFILILAVNFGCEKLDSWDRTLTYLSKESYSEFKGINKYIEIRKRSKSNSGWLLSQQLPEIEREIISDLIIEEFFESATEADKLDNGKKNDIVIISDSYTKIFNQRVDSLEKFRRMGLSHLDFYTLNDFYRKNQTSMKIPEFHPEKIDIKFMPQKEWDEIMDQGSWKKYHSIYGYIPTINLSRPGINENMNKTFMYYDAKMDKLGGAGFYIILERINKKWIVKEKIIAWRS